jgi:hypothetical protein
MCVSIKTEGEFVVTNERAQNSKFKRKNEKRPKKKVKLN